MKYLRLFEAFVNNAQTNETPVNENKYAKAGKLGYNDQFLNRRKSLAKTISTELGLKKEFVGPWVGFDYIDMYVIGDGIGGTVLSGALDGSHTYDDLKAAAAEYLKGKGVKVNESVVNEAKVDAEGFSDEFASLVYEVEEPYGEEISSAAIASLLTVIWDEVVEQNNFHEMVGSLALAFRNVKVAMDDTFKVGRARNLAKDFGANMYDSTGFSWSGTMECFNELFSQAGASNAQVKKLEKLLNGWFDQANESVVNEEKINVRKEIKDLKRMGYDAEDWGSGIVVRNHTAPNPNWHGTTDYVWDPEDGIYSDDDRYSGDDHSYSQFLEILDEPTWFEGEWG